MSDVPMVTYWRGRNVDELSREEAIAELKVVIELYAGVTRMALEEVRPMSRLAEHVKAGVELVEGREMERALTFGDVLGRLDEVLDVQREMGCMLYEVLSLLEGRKDAEKG